MEKRLTRISKFLSLVLRHEPTAAGVQLDPDGGWVAIPDLLTGCARAGHAITLLELKQVVAENNKNRFQISNDGLRIRAVQGHSVQVEMEYAPAYPPEFLYHGTVAKFYEAIAREGLRKMDRLHVHLSPDMETARIVGARRGVPVILKIHANRMHRDGRTFFLSPNGVWLTEHVPPSYIVLLESPARK